MKPDSHLLVGIDAAVIASVSAAICLASEHLLFMTVVVPCAIMCRMLVLAVVKEREGVSMAREILFLGICTAVGAYNDWNSVCNKKIYVYCVPNCLESCSIPLWMLLYWGMILRFIARLARWTALAPERDVSNVVGIDGMRVESAVAKVLAELLVVAATRQAIYRYYLDPVLSWLPFLVGLPLSLLVLAPSRHDLKLLAVFLVGGPAVEILYIRVGHLHQYHLGWIWGVPLWIVIWWLLAVFIWKDLALRIEKGLLRLSMRGVQGGPSA